jgi:hypothetical protein
MFWFVLWLGLGLIGTFIGMNKKAGGCSTAFSFILGPIGLLSAILYKPPICPYCKEVINKDAAICPHCRTSIK